MKVNEKNYLTEDEKSIIRARANSTPLTDLAKELNCPYKQVYAYLETLPMSKQFREHYSEYMENEDSAENVTNLY